MFPSPPKGCLSMVIMLVGILRAGVRKVQNIQLCVRQTKLCHFYLESLLSCLILFISHYLRTLSWRNIFNLLWYIFDFRQSSRSLELFHYWYWVWLSCSCKYCITLWNPRFLLSLITYLFDYLTIILNYWQKLAPVQTDYHEFVRSWVKKENIIPHCRSAWSFFG